MMKNLLTVMAALVFLASVQPVQGSRLADGADIPIPILAYHNIGPQALSKWYVSAEQFERQMDVLQAYGYQTVGLQDYLDYRSGAAQPPEKPIIITFDDGYQGVHTYALPILRARGMTASIFIPTGMIGDEGYRQDNTWLEYEPLSYHLIWPEVLALADAGFEIGSHTVNHWALGSMSKPTAAAELVQSRQDILGHLPEEITVDFLAYPYGSDVNPEFDVHGLVEEAGYKAALDFGDPQTIANPAIPGVWALPRRTIDWDVPLDFNPENPDWFFMRRVKPDFHAPNIIHQPWQVLGADGLPRALFYPGETVTVKARVKGGPLGDLEDPVPVIASILLQHGESDLYDSHRADTDVELNLQISGWPVTTFTYQWTIPPNAPPGEYSGTLSVRDLSYLLGFYRSAPEALFAVGSVTYLPFIAR